MTSESGQRTLCGFWASPFLSVAAQFLLEADLPFEYLRVSPFIGEVHAEAHKVRNPLGKIPTLIEPDGTMVSESQAIGRYLARSYASARFLYPCDDPKLCARVDALNDFYTFTVSGPFFNMLVVGSYFPGPLGLRCEAESTVFRSLSLMRIREGLHRIMTTARPSPYLLGSEPRMPDFQLYQLLEAGEVFGRMLDMPDLDLAATDERLTQYRETMRRRGSSQEISRRREAEIALTRQEIFGRFPEIRAAGARKAVMSALGREV